MRLNAHRKQVTPWMVVVVMGVDLKIQTCPEEKNIRLGHKNLDLSSRHKKQKEEDDDGDEDGDGEEETVCVCTERDSENEHWHRCILCLRPTFA